MGQAFIPGTFQFDDFQLPATIDLEKYDFSSSPHFANR